jgi:hypothetical protein
MTLRKTLALHGFESNDDYDFPLRCLFAAPQEHLRCLNLTGAQGRRKTAFANALGLALDYPHRLYHDFSAAEPPPPPIVLSTESTEMAESLEAPLTAFERVVTEACAYSEGAKTILVLDQLQAADFKEHIRIYHFVSSREWSTGQGTVVAQAKNLLLVLISEEPLYHSLAKVSFRLHTDAGRGGAAYRPEDFGLPPVATEFMLALDSVFEAVGAAPTPGEYRRILTDLHGQVRTVEQLRQCLYGWTEGLDRAALYARPQEPLLDAAQRALDRYFGIEEIELGGE